MAATLERTFTLVILTAFSWAVVSTDDLPYYCAFCDCKNTTYGGFSTNCSMKGLFNPPRTITDRTTELHLQRNLFQVVKYQHFAGLVNLKCLDMSQNTITSIEIGAFRDLTNLECLFLNGQKTSFFLPQIVFKPGVFSALQKLRILYIHNNVDFRDAMVSKIPSESLKYLTNLNRLRIDGFPNMTFNESFKALENLTVLELSGDSGTCEIKHLDESSFVGLVSLKRLTMVNCHIKTIKYGTFTWLRNLEYLDISWNTDLGFDQFGRVAEDLMFNTQLKYLNISAIHDPNRAGIELLRHSVRHLRTMKIIEIQMNDNGIEFVDFGVFSLFPSSLKRLYMRGNKLNFGIYMEEAIFNNRNLTIFDAANQHLVLRSDRAFTSTFGNAFGGGLFNKKTNANFLKHKRSRRSEDLGLELRTLICSGSSSDIRLLDFMHTDNNITRMDLSRNFLPKLHAHAFAGLPVLIYLNLSNNYIEFVHETAFGGLRNLEVLDLENNLMGMTVREDKHGMLFRSLESLRELRMSRNRIYRIDKDLFTHLYNIKVIDLSENFLETIDLTLTALSNLNGLDLSSNRLLTLQDPIRQLLNRLAKHQTISVNINRNSFTCNCANMPFIEWLVQPSAIWFIEKEQYYCFIGSGGVQTLNGTWSNELEQLKEDCVSHLEIIVGVSTFVSFICAIFISYFVYYNRWRLRYMYYMAKVKLQNEDKREDNENVYEFDAFLSYGDGDRVFATEDMRLNLEDVSGKKLNIRDRDFELGEAIAINISRAIRTSKRTFLLVSRYFLKNKWCNFEMNMAIMEEIHQKRKVIVIVFLETIPLNMLPIELLDLLRKCPNTDLPEDPELLEVFWHKCVQYIRDI